MTLLEEVHESPSSSSGQKPDQQTESQHVSAVVRDASKERRWTPRKINKDDVPPNYMQLAAVIFSVVGLMLKYRWCSWLGLLTCVSTLLNLKKTEFDLKQLVTTILMAIIGLFLNYFGPNNNKFT